jgi:hypothetical protein
MMIAALEKQLSAELAAAVRRGEVKVPTLHAHAARRASGGSLPHKSTYAWARMSAWLRGAVARRWRPYLQTIPK